MTRASLTGQHAVQLRARDESRRAAAAAVLRSAPRGVLAHELNRRAQRLLRRGVLPAADAFCGEDARGGPGLRLAGAGPRRRPPRPAKR